MVRLGGGGAEDGAGAVAVQGDGEGLGILALVVVGDGDGDELRRVDGGETQGAVGVAGPIAGGDAGAADAPLDRGRAGRGGVAEGDPEVRGLASGGVDRWQSARCRTPAGRWRGR